MSPSTTQTAPTFGLNGAAAPPGTARPLPTSARRPGLVAAAVVLIVGFALAGGMLVSGAAGKTEVLVAAGAVPAGHALTTADVRATSVAGDLRAIRAADLNTVLGQTTAVGLVPGQLLNRDMLTAAVVPGAGQAMVGLSLPPGRLPSDGLAAGDRVQAIAAPTTAATASASPRLLAIGEVYAIRADATTSGDTLVTLIASTDAAARLATYGATGQVSLIKVPSLAPAGGGS